MKAKKLTFAKAERISRKEDIELLFETGHSFKAFPLRILFTEKTPRDAETGVSVLISVSKKRFKRAVDRNRIKRLIREAYRLNSSELKVVLSDKGLRLLIAFIYIGQEIGDYKTIESMMQRAFMVLKEKLS